jgi:hypothetical protein
MSKHKTVLALALIAAGCGKRGGGADPTSPPGGSLPAPAPAPAPAPTAVVPATVDGIADGATDVPLAVIPNIVLRGLCSYCLHADLAAAFAPQLVEADTGAVVATTVGVVSEGLGGAVADPHIYMARPCAALAPATKYLFRFYDLSVTDLDRDPTLTRTSLHAVAFTTTASRAWRQLELSATSVVAPQLALDADKSGFYVFWGDAGAYTVRHFAASGSWEAPLAMAASPAVAAGDAYDYHQTSYTDPAGTVFGVTMRGSNELGSEAARFNAKVTDATGMALPALADASPVPMDASRAMFWMAATSSSGTTMLLWWGYAHNGAPGSDRTKAAAVYADWLPPF